MGLLLTKLSDVAVVRFLSRAFFMLGDSIRPIVQKPLVKQFIGCGHPESALDAGCGRGMYTRVLLKRAANVTALDFDPNHIAALKRRLGHLPNLSLQVGSADNMPFKDEQFDLVIHCEVLEHIPDDKKTVSELWRVLKPGGRLILSVPVPPAPYLDRAHVREGYTYEQISGLLKAQGFEVKRHQYCMFKFTKALMTFDNWWKPRFKIPPPTILLLPVWIERWFIKGDAKDLPYDIITESIKPAAVIT